VLVPYCTVGLRASVVYLAARSLGLEVRLYDGSMAEWTRHADYPLIRGEQR
jgi:3-mercaptopyruvate sulfurtransferase SseA